MMLDEGMEILRGALPNPNDWPVSESTWDEFQDRVLELLPDLTEEWGKHVAGEIAGQQVAGEIITELLTEAMNVAVMGYLLGAADGDGQGGAHKRTLDRLIEERLYPDGRPARRAPYRTAAQIAREKNKISAIVRGRVMQRDADRCQGCGATDDLTIDHITPIAKGGTSAIENLQVLCRPCNSSKGVK